MKFYNCPKCEQDTMPSIYSGNPFFLISPNKSCSNCGLKIRINLIVFFILFISIIASVLSLLFSASYFYWIIVKSLISESKSHSVIMALIILLPLNFIIPFILGNFFKLRFFITNHWTWPGKLCRFSYNSGQPPCRSRW